MRSGHCAMMRIGATVVMALSASTAFAQSADNFPSRPIRLIVPFAAGGPTDILGRTVGQHMAQTLGQQVVVENRVGAGGVVGAEAVAKSPPDGYTIVMGATGAFAVNMTLMPKLPYDVMRDFAPISLVAVIPFVLVVHPDTAVRTVRDMIELARAKPDTVTAGSAGVGTSMHMATEMFRWMTKTRIVHVPYKGAAPALTDLASGQLQAVFADTMTAAPHIRGGKVRAVAVTQKTAQVPASVPTFAEAGLPEYTPEAWFGLFAPAGTPREIVQKLAQAVAKAADDPTVKDRLTLLGSPPTSSTPEAFSEFVRAEIAKWRTVVRESGAKID